MIAITFDTLEFTEQLKAAGVPEEQAKGHVRAFSTAMKQVEGQLVDVVTKRDKQVEGRLDELASKRDIQELELASKRDIQELELASKRDIQELDAKFGIKIKELEVKIAESKAEMIKWMFGVAAGQAAFIVGILKLFPSH